METKDGTAPPDAGARGKRLELSAELLSILLVGAALAALILTGVGEIREDMRERFSSMEGRMSLMEGRMSSMEGRLAVVEREQGEIRGLLEGMRDTAAGRPGPRRPRPGRPRPRPPRATPGPRPPRAWRARPRSPAGRRWSPAGLRRVSGDPAERAPAQGYGGEPEAVALGLQGPGCIPTPRAPRVAARVATDPIAA